MNKKEEVLDIKLTAYGKRLLSLGKFEPVYYSFHDEGVLYDSDYAGFTESQNAIQDRILDNTPVMRTQHNFTSAAEKNGIIRIKNADDTITEIDTYQIATRDALGPKLGNSEQGNQNFPALKLKIYNGEITSIDNTYTGSFGSKIPQINCKVVSHAQVRDVALAQNYENPFGTVSSPISPNGSYISVNVSNFLLELVEENTSFDSENFEIEVFDTNINHPLSFANDRRSEKIVGGILTDNPESQDENYVSPTRDNVEYYFHLNTDDDIPYSVIDAASAHFKSKGFYNDVERNPVKGGTTLEIADIYSSTTDAHDIEDCK